jgi:hypothetical protein
MRGGEFSTSRALSEQCSKKNTINCADLLTETLHLFSKVLVLFKTPENRSNSLPWLKFAQLPRCSASMSSKLQYDSNRQLTGFCRSHFIDKYCSTELREYRRIFRATDEVDRAIVISVPRANALFQAGQLDNISRRFAWFKRILKLYDDEHSRAFPPSWNVGQHLCAKFLDITRDDLAGVLEKSAKILTVTLLLSSLKQTQEFEAYVAQKYNEPVRIII